MIQFTPQSSLAAKASGMSVLAGTSPYAISFPNVQQDTNPIYLFYSGSGGDGIWYTTAVDGVNWSAVQSIQQQQIGMGVLKGTSPAAAVFGGQLYLFYNGSGRDGIWYTVSSDGKTWSTVRSIRAQQLTMNVMDGTSANAVVFQNVLYVFYTGSGGDGTYYVSSSDGKTWLPPVSVAAAASGMGVLAGTSPSAVVYDNMLYLFFTGSGKDGIFYTAFNGRSWTPVAQVAGGNPPAAINTSPAAFLLSIDPTTLYVLWNGGSNELWIASYDGSTWSSASIVNNGTQAATSAAATEFLDQAIPYIFWNGKGQDGIWYTTALNFIVSPQSMTAFISNITANTTGANTFFSSVVDPDAVKLLDTELAALPAAPVSVQFFETTSATAIGVFSPPADGSRVVSRPTQADAVADGQVVAAIGVVCAAVVLALGIVYNYELVVKRTRTGWSFRFGRPSR